MISESMAMLGILTLMCGVFALCVLGAVLLGVIAVKISREEKGEVRLPSNAVGEANKADGAIFKQWDNLLGYNGAKGDDFDE